MVCITSFKHFKTFLITCYTIELKSLIFYSHFFLLNHQKITTIMSSIKIITPG